MNYVLGLIVIFLLWPAQLSDTASAFDQNRAVALNQKGQKLLQESKFTQALEVFRELRLVCQTDKYCNGIALFGMATCQFELATYEDAMRSLEEADAIFSELNKPLERARVLKSIGEIFATKTDYDSALKYLEKARAACTQAGRDGTAELFWILTGMANANIYLSRPQQATKNLDDAEALMAGRLQPLQDALLQYLAGRIAQDRQDYKLAKERLSSALKYFERVDNRKRVQSILNAMGLMEEHQANYPEAQRLYDRALAIAQSIKDPAETAFIYNNLGSVLWKRGNYDQAKRSYEEALKIRRDLGIRLHYADTLNNLGIVQIAYGNYSQAFEKFKEAYNIAREIGSPLVQAWTLHDMAWLYKDQGNLMESQRFSLQAVDLAKKTPDKRLLATVLLRLGNLHEYYGDFEGALKHYNEAERNYNEIREWLYRSNTLLDIASIYTRQGAPEDAKPKFEEALVIKRKIGAPTGEAFCKFALFYLEKYQYLEDKDRVTPAQRQFDLGQADAHLRQAQKAIDPEDKNALMLLGYARGRYLLEVDPAGSIGQFASLKDLAKSTGSLKYSFLASVGLGLANEKLGKLDEAEKAFEDAVNYAEDIRKTLDPDTRRTFLHGEEILGMKHVVPYEGLARVRLKKGDHAKSLEASEFTKARSFADKMARSIPGAAFGVEAKVLDDLEKVENQIRSNHRRITECTAKGGDSALVPDLTRHRENLDENLLRLEQRIRKEYPDFYAVRFPSRLPIAESGLRDGEVVLAYEVTDTGVLVFLLKGKKIVEANFKEVARKYLDNLVRKFRQPFEDVGKTDDPKEQQRYLASFDPRVGKELYDLLLKDTVGRLQAGERIAIVPDDCLSVLPFEMLVTNGGGQVVLDNRGFPATRGMEFFADHHSVVYYQSITALTLARRLKHKDQPLKVLVIANPTTGDSSDDQSGSQTVTEDRKAEVDRLIESQYRGKRQDEEGLPEQSLLSLQTYNRLSAAFGPLPVTEELAKDLQAQFGENADVYSRAQATMAAFREEIIPKINRYDKIIFATHGYAGDEFRPEIEEPFLVLSLIQPRSDNLLRMSAVMDLPLNADLVTLIACQSGLGKQISGEGTMGMGRAFQYAGSKSVLMSLWSVEEKASVQLVRTLLEQTSKGADKLEALKRARDQLRQTGWDHPFFWAAFVLVGEGN